MTVVAEMLRSTMENLEVHRRSGRYNNHKSVSG